MGRVIVVGGGFFGTCVARQVSQELNARDGQAPMEVVLLEKEAKILQAASKVNQVRVHLGYHYPRSHSTAGQCANAYQLFLEWFGEGCLRPRRAENGRPTIRNYYAVAPVSEGSKIDSAGFEKFFSEANLSYSATTPPPFAYNKDLIDAWYEVEEAMLDPYGIYQVASTFLAEDPNIRVICNAEVTGIKRVSDARPASYMIQYSDPSAEASTSHTLEADYVFNCTYVSINSIDRMLNIPIEAMRYEQVEEWVISLPPEIEKEDRVGFAIMDGPFFGIMPWGNEGNEFIVADVVLSRIEVYESSIPFEFKKPLQELITGDQSQKRWEKFVEERKRFLPWLSQCKYLYSVQTHRVLQLLENSKNDERPTLIDEKLPGYTTVFSGKIVVAPHAAQDCAKMCVEYLERNSSQQN